MRHGIPKKKNSNGGLKGWLDFYINNEDVLRDITSKYEVRGTPLRWIVCSAILKLGQTVNIPVFWRMVSAALFVPTIKSGKW